MNARWGSALTLALAGFAAPAQAQDTPLRLAAPADCSTNPNCAPGFERVYGIDAAPDLVKLTVADAGIQALDDGLAEVAVAFSSNPQLSRPDIVTLRDDQPHDRPRPRRPGRPQRAAAPLRAGAAAAAERRLAAADHARAARAQPAGRSTAACPRRSAASSSTPTGSAATAGARRGPRIVVGFQDFAENETLAHLYAEALRGGGFRVTVRGARRAAPEAVAALRSGRIDI